MDRLLTVDDFKIGIFILWSMGAGFGLIFTSYLREISKSIKRRDTEEK